MIKIDLTVPYISLDELPIKNEKGEIQTLGRVAASTLASATKVDALKFLSWAQKLYNNEAIEVDESDFKTIRDFFKNKEGLFALFVGQILKRLDECEVASKK